ncbi:GNAT family N-acetyltransferase [Asticcacaulis sp. YBE204]|uniref:GNAT family N-acetyltransferase n=1 Tax=Asticcacaulis sp. YBE204 TaxID=1282363 RepID=UPI0003C40937|nr:GNAT family N-acetyltransferase [Asticcacaulis sp. YBE204]ESQ77799.1 hypothetical protein AEYBE204_16855 [Asticcacaulis sp. YBE204]
MISFRPLTDNDAGLLLLWMSSPHVQQWWGHDGQSAEDAVEDALAYVGAANGTGYIFNWHGQPAGYVQSYECCPDHEADDPCYAETPRGTFLIDLFIGDASLLGEGVGTEALRMVCEGMFKKGAQVVRVAPHTANAAAVRCCEKAGFTPSDASVSGGLRLMCRTPDVAAFA